MKLKLSQTLSAILSPIIEAVGNLPAELAIALHKSGKRGKAGTYYPGDFRRIETILCVQHDVTGRMFEAMVENGNVEGAIQELRNLWNEEDYLCEIMPYAYAF